jgi:hypothetical protein
MAFKIGSVEDALDALAEIQNTENFNEEIELIGDLEFIQIHVNGDKYHGTVPGEFARGLWEYQEAFYKAAAFALTGADDIRKLTTAQRETLEFVFTVSNGSSALTAPIKDFVKTLGDGFTAMDNKTKAIVLVALAILLCGGVLGWKALENSAAAKADEVKASMQAKTQDVNAATQLNSDQERTKQFELIARIANQNKVVQKFSKASEDGTRAVIRSASDANEVRIGRVIYRRIDIEEVNQRAPKTASQATIVDAIYFVFGTESKLFDSTKYTLNGPDGEFPVNVDHSELTADELNKLWDAAKTRTPIRLEVAITKNKGQIKAAQVITVF